MIRTAIAFLLAAMALRAEAQGVYKPKRPDPETILWTASFGALNAASTLGGRALPSGSGFTVEYVGLAIVTAGGGGAGNTVITLTDGTNTCTATFACTSTSSTGAKRVAVVNGSGAGCVFPVGAAITASVTTAGCTTTQPSCRNFDVFGRWR